MRYLFSELKLNEKKMVEKVEEYKSKQKFQTYIGLLNFLGIGSREMMELREMAMGPNNRQAKKMVAILEKYKFGLEEKMEEYLMYQGTHPDLKNCYNYNYNQLQFLLKASNPTKYGDKKQVITSAGAKSGSSNDNKLEILENKSELKWSQ